MIEIRNREDGYAVKTRITKLQNLADFLINKIFPRQCIGCKKIGQYICPSCMKKMAAHPYLCPICHQKSHSFHVCKNCKKIENPPYEGIIIGFRYCDLIKKLILKLKYYHKYDIAEFFANKIKLLLQAEDINLNNTVITFVPSHWTRKYFVKGYNQSQLLAREISQKLCIKYQQICTKIRITKSQTNIKKQERLTNLVNAFTLSEQLKGDETVLIIDDITTTGATIKEVAQCIKTTYPNTKIRGVVIARKA